MKAVSNTTPLRYLIAISQENLLEKLFEKVLVPVAVHEELIDPRTPQLVRQTVAALPAWLEVRKVDEKDTDVFPVVLHRGERQAILLAEAVRADVLLIDEQIGRAIARERNLPLSGTLGILERADTMGYVKDFPEIVRRLKTSGFYLTDALEQQLVERSRRRQIARGKNK